MRDEEMIKYICDICGKETESDREYKNDWKRLHWEEDLGNQDLCPECFKGVINSIRLMQKTRTSSVTEAMKNMLMEVSMNDARYKLGEVIRYSPIEMHEILDKRLGK